MKRTMIQTLLGDANNAFPGDVRLDLGSCVQDASRQAPHQAPRRPQAP
jgi:hypothetical protein